MQSVGAAITAALPLEQTKAVIALILFALNSSANAMTVIFKDYKAATAMKGLFIICISMVSGIIELNGVLEEKRQQPLFCLHEKLELTIEQVEDIMMRQAEKITDPDQLPIGLLLAQGLQNTFPATKSISGRNVLRVLRKFCDLVFWMYGE